MANTNKNITKDVAVEEKTENFVQKKEKTKTKDCNVLNQRDNRCVIDFDGLMVSVNVQDKKMHNVLCVEYVGEIGTPDFKIVKVI